MRIGVAIFNFLSSLFISNRPQEQNHEPNPHPPSPSTPSKRFLDINTQGHMHPSTRSTLELAQANTIITIGLAPSSSSLSPTPSTSTLSLSSTQEVPEQPEICSLTGQECSTHDTSILAHPTSSPRPRPFHPIVETVRQQDLGRHTMLLAVPMAIGLFTVYKLVDAPLVTSLIAISLAVGVVAILNGILFRGTCRKAPNVMELMGISFMLLALFGIIACFLPESLIWIPAMCWVLSLAPFVVALANIHISRGPHNHDPPEPSAARPSV